MDRRKDGRKDGRTNPISWYPSGRGGGSNNKMVTPYMIEIC